MKLSAPQKRVLSAVLLQAGRSHSEIARLLGIREHTVRRTVALLEGKKVFLGRRIFVNPYAFGMTQYIVFLLLPARAQQYRAAFRKALCDSEQAGAVVELGGEFEFGVQVYARDIRHLQKFFDEISRAFPHRYVIQECLPAIETEYSGLADPIPELSPPPVLRFGPVQRVASISELDSRVLYALANTTYHSLQDVARSLSLPATTLSYRIEALEDAGVIAGHYHLMDPEVLGELPMTILAKSKTLVPSERDALCDYCRAHPRIAWITFFMGRYSAEIFVRASNYDSANSLVREILTRFPELFESLNLVPQLSFPKYTMYPFRSHSSLTA